MYPAPSVRSSHPPVLATLPQMGEVVDGRYLILAELGGGSGGVVYLADHLVTGQRIAMKWLRPELARSMVSCERFARETRIASTLRHPSLVRVLDAGQSRGTRYLVTEHVEGRPLSDLIAGGPLPPTALVDMILPALRGVAAAHEAGIVHRDLKPENILVGVSDADGCGGAKVLDFGVSRSTSLDEMPLTREGSVLGSPAYMAPEQLRDTRAADARSDVYSIGVLLYEGLTGKLPFEGSTLSELARRIMGGVAAPIRSHRPEVSASLAEIVHRAMACEPTRRPGTMRALADALAAWREQARATEAPFIAPLSVPSVAPIARSRFVETMVVQARTLRRSALADVTPHGAMAIAITLGAVALACAITLG